MSIHQIGKYAVQVTHLRHPVEQDRVAIAIFDQQGTPIHQTGGIPPDLIAQHALAGLFPSGEEISAEDLAPVMSEIRSSPTTK